MRRKSTTAGKSRLNTAAELSSGEFRQDDSPSILPFPQVVEGAGRSGKKRRSGYYIVPPTDINVRGVDIPSVKKRDLRAFLQYRMRSLYPGDSNLTAFDYLLSEAGGLREALLCICRSDVLEQHRAAAGGKRLVVPLSFLMPVLPPYHDSKLAYVYFGGDSTEIDLFEKNRIVSSTVLVRNQEQESDELKRILERFEGDSLYCVVQCPDDTTAFRISEELAKEVENLRISDVDSAVKALDRRHPLFDTRKSGSKSIWQMVSASLTVIALICGILVLQKAIDGEEEYASSLALELEEAQSQADRTMSLEKTVLDLRKRVEALRERPFAEPYRLLSDLSDVLAGDFRIESFFLEAKFFQIEAVGGDPLVMMRRFDAFPSFKSLRIAQVVEADGTEQKRFTLTGEYHAR